MSIPTFGAKKQLGAQKKLKDSNAPKKPITSFIAFSMTERAKVQADLGTQAVAEVGKELGRRWGELDTESRAEYQITSNKDKERFAEAMKSYKPSEEFLQKKAEVEAKAATAMVTGPGMDSGRFEAYFTFLFTSWQQVHMAHPEYSGKDIQDMVWQHWVTSKQASGLPSAAHSSKQQKKPKKVRDPLAPKKPLSSYFLFINNARAEVMSSMPQLTHREVISEMGKRWTGLEEAARAPFIAEADRLKAEYLVAMEEYRRGKGKDQGKEVIEVPAEDGLE